MQPKSFVRRVLPSLAVLAGLLALWYAWHRFAEANINPHVDASAELEPDAPLQVELSDAQLAAGKVACETVEPQARQTSTVVPGRLSYDETQRVSVRLGTEGMLTKINVQPGDSVEAGQVLATMSSPEIGTARADEMQYAEELKLAKRQADWDRTRAAGIHKLVDAIHAGQPPASIREHFTGEAIGAAREKLLSAYSNQLLAKSLISRLESAQESGALPARTIEERKRNFENAEALLQGEIEQTIYDADRTAQSAEIGLNDAERRWKIAAGRVSTLLGMNHTVRQENSSSPPAPRRPADTPPADTPRADTPRADTPQGNTPPADSPMLADAEDLSQIEIRAPRSGTVEQKLYNENERVEAGAVLFVLADTSRLWLRADLRESQWTALALKAGQKITASSPALPDETLQATIVRMGREVDPRTNAISLVASVENPYGRLRPGLYMQVELPLGEVTSQIVIPESAVARHAREAFVFVTDDGHRFVRRNVRLGKSQDGWSEVLAGLSPGERIATGGVFVLKSELLLEIEE